MSRITLTIYLIKESYSHGRKCIRENELKSLRATSVSVPDATRATIYLRKNTTKRPEWRDLFPALDWSKYQTNTFSGLLLVDISGKKFALTAGNGRYLLNPFSVEEGFGFKTVINSVDPSTIRKIEKKTINQNPMNSISQLTRTAGLQDFRVDYFTDIVSKIKAKSTIEDLGNLIDGRDSLQISIERDIDYLGPVLMKCLEAYQSDAYLEHFPDIDNISSVNDRELSVALDELLVTDLNKGELTNAWAAMPEIIQDEEFDVFQYTRRQNARRYYDIELADCLLKYTSRGHSFTKQNLEKDEIFIRKQDGSVYPKWRVWKCIYAEISHEGQLYVLVEGKWFQLSQDYIELLDEIINSIPANCPDLPEWKQQKSEENYLKSIGGDFLVFDQQLVRVPGQTPIEFCDLYLPDNTFIHVKRYGNSNVLSYLFEQGRTSAKLFLEDKRYREHAVNVFGEYAPFTAEDRPDPRD